VTRFTSIQRNRSAVAATLIMGAMTLTLTACAPSAPTGSADSSPGTHAASTPPGATSSARPTEVSPPGDIPDDQAFVTFTDDSGAYSLEVPEGWARQASGTTTTFTDKLNSISTDLSPSAAVPTVDSVNAVDVPALASSQANFILTKVEAFNRPGGNGILITYLADSPVNEVTGTVVRDEVQRYLFWKDGQQAALTLSGPQGSDNVDPWARVSGSFRWLS
jgi:hypothetical protein